MTRSSAENWERVKELFEEALERDAKERVAFLRERAAEPGLREEVLRLLAEYDRAGSFLSNPVHAALSAAAKDSALSSAVEGSLARGQILADRFQLIRFLAKGGMGEVYEAEDRELSAGVAVKIIRPELLLNQGALRRFKREVHVAKKVTHPNV